LWSAFDKYFISLMKAYYGDAATRENEWGFHWLPRVTGDHSHFGYWLDMADGKLEGLFVMGQNPAVGASNGRLERTAMSKLKWLVVRDMVETETASFWYDSPEVNRGELSPDTIGTEVFLFPAAGTAEKKGTFTNTQRLLQYREKAVDPPGDARSETWFMYHLGVRLKEKAKNDSRQRNDGLRALTWQYSTEGKHAEPVNEEILQEINGYSLPDRKQLTHIKDLMSDGSTACGAWIYCGVFPKAGYNRALERNPKDALGHGWGFAWPNDCRIIYNRASARPDGQPWSERKKLVWWDESKQEWTGLDNPDYDKKTAPAADKKERPDNPYGESVGDPRFPYVLTTYRLTEHHTAGGMSRQLPHLSELQPQLFTEVSPELASELGLENGGWATIITARTQVEARVLVTPRMRPLQIAGRTVHQVGLPYHWGYRGQVTGDVVNDLLAISEEPNVRIMETKALTCDLAPGRRARGKQLLREIETLQGRSA
jgi:formate dehydrogenase major subunit